jgi:chromosome segregation ATPase
MGTIREWQLFIMGLLWGLILFRFAPSGLTGKDKRRRIMKEIKLLSMELENFKGVKKRLVDFDGKDTDIYGENETGKTTFADAFSWLFFDKDTMDQSPQKFDIKPLDENNEVIHGLVTSVKATLQIDGSQKTYEKKYEEDWERKKGSANKVFTGHTITRYVSGAKFSKSKFDKDIKDNIAPENIFRLLTDPRFFNEQLHWKKRRKILTDYVGGIENNEVFEANEKLKELEEALEQRKIEDHKSMLKDQKDDINEQRKKLPIRIDEVNKGIPELPDRDKQDIHDEIKDIKLKKKELEKQLSGLENGGEIAEKRKKLAELDTELQQIKLEHTKDYEEKITELKSDGEDIKDDISDLERKIRNKKTDIKENQSKMKELKETVNELVASFNKVKKEEIKVEDKCPTCGQELPDDQLEKAKKKANRDKSQRLENINQQGNNKKQQYLELKEKNSKLKDEIEELKGELQGLKKVKDDLFEELYELKEKSKAYKDNFQYQKKLKEKENVQETINQIKGNSDSAAADIKEKINTVENKISSLDSELKKFDDHEKAQKRIDELKAEEKKLSKKYEELEREYYLCGRFEKTKAELLEERVNDKFKLAKFKLFEKNINGSIEPTCRTVYDGVPYNTNLNNGHKTIVGVDIINTLSDHYQFRAPIFVDNYESITSEIDSDSQLIKLIAKKYIKDPVIVKEEESYFDKLCEVFGEDKAKEILGIKEAS